MTLFALSAQAQITGVDNYTDLQNEAVLAAGDATIRLIDNITDGAAQLTIGRSLTLDLNGFDLTILLDDPTGQTSNGIKINTDVTLTIIDSSLPSTGTLTVTNGATVNPTAGNGAAINTTDGTLIIDSGAVTATSGRLGAGIGGGNGGNGGTITISGGTVIATSGDGGAGIGGGWVGNGGGNITISGGTVTATSGAHGAGIGSSTGGGGGTIAISGGTVTANGGTCGAGIGGGNGSASGTITVSGDAIVTAKGGNALFFVGAGAAGIGSGGASTSNPARPIDSITITTTGTVTATGGAGDGNFGAGAAIGRGGYNGGGNGAGIATVPVTAHPANPPAVTAGQTAAFAFAVTPVGTIPPAPAYQWEVSSGGVFANVTDGAGGTTASYTTAATTIAMNGNLYRNVATVSNVNGNNSGTITYTSHSATLTVNKASSTLTLTANPAGSVALPNSVTLTATLTGAAPLDGHSIEFFVDGASVGTGTTNASGVATFEFTPTSVGTYGFHAEFAADANNNAASATPINGYAVNKASPTLTLTANPAGSVTLSGNVTLTATLTGAAPLNGHTIEFFMDGASIGAGTTDAAGVATFAFAPLNTGTYVFGAEFSGDVDNDRAEAAINGYVVRQAGGTVGAVASIPTLNPAMLMLLALALGGMAFRQNRRKV